MLQPPKPLFPTKGKIYNISADISFEARDTMRWGRSALSHWDDGYKRRGISWKGAVALLIVVLWITSFASLGFVGIAGKAAEGWASLAWVEKGAAALLVLGLLLMLVGSFARAVSGRAAFLALGVILLVVGGIMFAFAHIAVLNDSPSQIKVIELKAPIDTTSARLVPLYTAYAYAVSMLQTATHTIYEDETYVYYDSGGHIIYNWVIEPEGFWNQISKEPLGVVLVNGSVFPPKVYVIKKRTFWGLHRLLLNPFFIDNLWREVKLRAGMGVRVLMDCNVEVLYKGKPYILIPLATWRVGPTTSVPVPVGYAVVSPDGSISVISLKEAASSPLFRGVPLVPDVIAREWVEIYRYHTGFWNVFLYHNTYTIRDVGTNPQPYLMTDKSGHLYWVFVAEPPGMTYSAKYIFYVNASDPNPHIMIYELPNPVIGISKLASLVKQAHPTYDWGEFMVEEPMPIIVNGTLYWKVTVITRDGRGLVSVDLVDTRTNEVRSIKANGTLTMDGVIAYLTGKHVTPSNITGGNTTIGAILQKIQELKQRIAQQEEELRKLYQELSTLERMLEELAKNQTKTATPTS